ncbi:Cysteine dioxygenase type 1 [Tupaia chinensis]|uniref:Cysteine dioxygenase type 1 n=1 Tax=Tupaia chinensis TaxID=246437 RepID=L9JCV4_TUPCH|nr:Cysteine dioxygenase type 1 [Tupaia chinensis]
MAEEPESVLQLPPSAAAGGEGLTEVSPETVTPEPPSSAAVSPGTEEPAGDTKKKIDILLKAVGDTPIMKTKKWAVERTRTIQGLIDFIKKFLKLVASEQLFIYVNQSFAPSPDQEVGTLYEEEEEREGKRRGKSVHQLSVTLEDFYSGATRKLALQKNVISDKCQGQVVLRGVLVARAFAAGLVIKWRSGNPPSSGPQCMQSSPEGYTRNLVDQGNGKFNLMILCWGEGHGSSIHDHTDSHCFLKMLQGNLKETLFAWPDKKANEMTKKSERILRENQCAYINDSIGLHRVENISHTEPAVSLHLYSPPFDSCHTFDQRTGHKNKVTMTFHSKFGTRTPLGSFCNACCAPTRTSFRVRTQAAPSLCGNDTCAASHRVKVTSSSATLSLYFLPRPSQTTLQQVTTSAVSQILVGIFFIAKQTR